MSRRVPGRPSSISSTLRASPSARVSTSCNTKPIHDPPAGNGPAGHIDPSAHPQSLNTSISIGIAPEGVRGQGTGKPDETERLMSGLERGRRKSTARQLADVLLYRTYGSVRGDRGNPVPYRHRLFPLLQRRTSPQDIEAQLSS